MSEFFEAKLTTDEQDILRGAIDRFIVALHEKADNAIERLVDARARIGDVTRMPANLMIPLAIATLESNSLRVAIDPKVLAPMLPNRWKLVEDGDGSTNHLTGGQQF